MNKETAKVAFTMKGGFGQVLQLDPWFVKSFLNIEPNPTMELYLVVFDANGRLLGKNIAKYFARVARDFATKAMAKLVAENCPYQSDFEKAAAAFIDYCHGLLTDTQYTHRYLQFIRGGIIMHEETTGSMVRAWLLKEKRICGGYWDNPENEKHPLWKMANVVNNCLRKELHSQVEGVQEFCRNGKQTESHAIFKVAFADLFQPELSDCFK